jgi:hypothetical protein
MRALFETINMSEADFKSPPFTRLKMLEALKASGALTEQLFWNLPKDLA